SGIFYPAKINTHERDQRVAELSNRVVQATEDPKCPPLAPRRWYACGRTILAVREVGRSRDSRVWAAPSSDFEAREGFAGLGSAASRRFWWTRCARLAG
ncbi:MAG: hypothetical protein M3460_30210, partial [Actinomycetota bacterium]|nr:hypothetical protein [Actinomycetota bacterium]